MKLSAFFAIFMLFAVCIGLGVASPPKNDENPPKNDPYPKPFRSSQYNPPPYTRGL
nr:uncharacterized protein LOC108126743 isoform X4 [Drosophila bipectinata]XP_043068498.1 uncharacterized protein LOC108126743 isoform X5 [Drosophila bipectinata]